MTEGLLWQIATRLRPQLKQMQGREQLMNFLVMVPVIFMGPFALASIVWLATMTNRTDLRDHALLAGLIAVMLLVIQHQQYTLQIETRRGELVPVTGSFDPMIVWSSALIAGPVVLWAAVLANLVRLVRLRVRARRLNQANGWMLISTFSQEITGHILTPLAGLALYAALGGGYPLHGFALADWGPAVAAMISADILYQIMFFPLLAHLSRVTGQKNTWLISLLILGTLVIFTPFSILGALIYSAGSPGLYVLFVVGIALVNYMAHYLSRANENSQQRARELARLEALGEALIQAPPDLSTLETVLREHISTMFPQDRLEIRLLSLASENGLVWPALTLTYPPDRPPLHDSDWQALRTANQTEITVPGVTPPGVSVRFGDALIVPIATDDPGEEGGEKEQLLGGIALLRHRDNGKTAHSLHALHALAAQIGSAYYRAQVHLETLTAQKMAQELELAGRIQAKFLPASVPQLAGWDIAAGLTPARQTSGDFYDFVPLADGRLGIVVADVADKGTGAALYMALSRTLIRTFAFQHPDAPEAALQAANERLLTDAESDQFVTVFYGVLDPAAGTLTYANAGHNPGFVLRGNGDDTITALGITGVPLGMFEGLAWKRACVTLATGDTLVLYTDGVSEAQDSACTEFGETRLCDAVRTQMGHPATAIHAAVTREVQAFVGDAPQFDDITLLVAARR